MFLTHRKQSVCGRCYHSPAAATADKVNETFTDPPTMHLLTVTHNRVSVLEPSDVLQVLVYRGNKRPNFGFSEQWSPKGRSTWWSYDPQAGYTKSLKKFGLKSFAHMNTSVSGISTQHETVHFRLEVLLLVRTKLLLGKNMDEG